MEKYKVEISELDHQGRGIGKIDNKVIFIKNALPTEIVEVEITCNKKNYSEGIPIKYLKTSSKRVKETCPYNKCGGCNFKHLSYKDELEYKENKIKNIVNKYLKANIKINKIIPSPKELYYRNKITLKVNKAVGLYQEKTNDIIPITSCQIVDSEINEIIEKINELNIVNINEIVIRKNTNSIMIIIDTNSKINEINLKQIFNSKNISIITKENKDYNLIKGKNYLEENLNTIKYHISPSAFFQINTSQITNLYDKVLEYMNSKETDTVLDLYCGIGSISLYVSKHVKKVLGIEINKEAIVSACENRELNNIKNVDFIANDVKNAITKLNFKPDIIITDPPRSGIDKEVIEKIIEILPQKIIYVSCDPLTLVRDLTLLNRAYDILEITPVDMFPKTYHVECVSVLHRKVTKE